ncbi:MAG: hypothetical protein OXU79_12795 [Gemmatimonadota bacterium]|nr:hypothetical protein [Gemmatimonadota bacterium]
MMVDLNSYPDYMDTGVDWLGEVPKHWDLRRTKSLLVQRSEKGFPNEPLLAATQTKGVVRKEKYENRTVLALKDLELLKIVRVGDFVISLRSFQGGIEFAREQGIISPAYTILYPRVPDHHAYLARVFKSRPYIENLSLFVTGIRQGQNIDYESLARSYLPLPPLTEQAAIVRFLDHADRRIKRYIRAKQKLIALLEEQKQAIIHQAVTGQIDVRTGWPYPAYKDSGVEWLGEVPEHWRIARLKVVLSEPTQNGIFKKKDQFGSGVPLINVADVYRERLDVDPSTLQRVETTPDESRRFNVQDGDIFFVRSSLKLEGTGRSAIAMNCSPDTVFECHLVQARPDGRQVNARYLVIQLNSFVFRHFLISRANMVTMATIAQDTISSCPVLMPPRKEQETIVNWLDAQWNRITHSIERENREIDLIQEYRTRLIADVVTGKLDVREAAAGLSEEDESTNKHSCEQPVT